VWGAPAVDSDAVAEALARFSVLAATLGHTVGETNDDLKALIAATPEYLGPGFLLPIRNQELFIWCVTNGLRIVIPMTHMSLGLYNEPQGAFLPGVLY
jgi:hypothetical protein